MAKSKYFELIFIFLVGFFQQISLAQTPPKAAATVSNPVSAEVSNPPAGPAPGQAGLINRGNPQGPKRPGGPGVPGSNEGGPPGSRFSLQDQKGLLFLSRINLREIDRIKWPDNPDLEGPSKVKYQDLDEIKNVSEKIKAATQNCKKQTAQYEVEVLANYGIKRGTILEFDDVCERLIIAMKRIKNPNHPAFKVVGKFILNRLDTALFRYLEAPEYERIKIYQKSIMGMLGLPLKYMAPLLQILVFLLLVLNGYLFYKVSS